MRAIGSPLYRSPVVGRCCLSPHAPITMDYEKLIQLIQQRPSLWNNKDANYHNRDLKMKIWGEIAEKLQSSTEAVRNKWSSLRDSFRREYKKLPKDIEGNVESKWPFFTKMSFLLYSSKDLTANLNEIEIKCESIDATDTSLLDPLEIPEANLEQYDGGSSNTIITAAQEDAETASNSDEHKSKKRKVTSTDKQRFQAELLEIEKEKLSMFKSKYENNEFDKDEDYCFALSLVSSMRKVPEKRKILMRMRIMQIISEEIPA